MSPARRQLLLLGAAGVAAGLAGAGWAWWRLALAPAQVDEGFWSRRFERPEGGELALAALRGKPLVLNFWATWCPPCRKEMPALSAISTKYRDRGVQFFGISIDTEANVRSFQTQTPVSYPLLIASPSAVQLTEALGNTVQALPFTVIVDKNGKIGLVKLGPMSEDELDRKLAELTRS